MKAFLSCIKMVAAALILCLAAFPGTALAHCDTLDGPVVKAARGALETGDVKPVLAWVQPGDEAQIRNIFERTIAVRKLSPDAKEFADNYFFETLVRVHRAGEGAPYTGLKPAGEVEPAVAASDKAIDTGSADQLLKELNGLVGKGVQKRFKSVIEKKKHAQEGVEAGREFVASYVEFVHYVEKLHADAAEGAHEHEHAQSGQQDHKTGHSHAK